MEFIAFVLDFAVHVGTRAFRAQGNTVVMP